MAMVTRFRVATRATGIRRQIWVHVYDDVEELVRAHQKARGVPYAPGSGIEGGVVYDVGDEVGGWHWPKPDPGPIFTMRLHTGALNTNVIAHEATHCAAAIYFMDCIPGWDSRARVSLLGDHEPLAYLVGDIAGSVVASLYREGILPRN